ncbi:LysR family transcriptional regulator [Bradyrhizobium sp. 190]|uniref:LysR family transcriptional regulator n=1 Tax=Bradyrhizobium sp. 190 TaxID=2782658 RepID=UPI001FFA8471|nr:LysR family transcriptional regulator [Bradyrhizobium sp. 190]
MRDLHILLAVARSGSMGKAAIDLSISQPSISKAIADVEHAVGLRLLDRGPQGIEPTIYGRALLKCGTAVFDELRQGVEELEFLTDPGSGELRLGCTETMAAGFVSAVSDRVSRQHPRVNFHLVPGDSITLVNRELRQRTIDFAIGPISRLNLDQDISAEILFDDKFVVMAGAESKWARRRKFKLADLIDEPWVLPPSDSVPGVSISQAFRAAGLEPPRAQMTSFSLPLHYHLLATGRVLTMLPLSMLRFGKHLPLKLLPADVPSIPYPTAIITLKNRTLSPIAQLFIAGARETAKPLKST